MSLSWLRRLIYGREFLQREEDVNKRLKAAETERVRIDSDGEAARRRLRHVVASCTQGVRKLDSDPPSLSLRQFSFTEEDLRDERG